MPRKKTVIEEVKEETTEVAIEETKAENKKESNKKKVEPESGYGVVINCGSLRIRSSAKILDNNIIAFIPVNTNVKVYFNESTSKFYKIQTAANIFGFVAKEFIKLK